ncbi:MAG: adenine deaminase [Anaerolineae bacterium]|nr:adenine deaminase [Anaerolineae bacterium]
MKLRERLEVARGERPADLLLTNGQVINVFTGEIYTTNIAIKSTHIVGVGEDYPAAKVIDLEGRYVAPGLIDAHVHIESSLCTPPNFSQAVLPHGVTTVITDPHELANVHGLDGIRFMTESAKYGLLSMYLMASSCVPATHMETSGAFLAAEDLRELLDYPWVLGLAEVMNFPGVAMGDPDMLEKIDAFKGLVLDGHCPAMTGKQLNAYITAGIQSDHERTTVEEAREKLRKGLTIFIREATNAQNLRTLLPLITPENHRRVCWCTDDRQPADLLDEGSIDYMIRVAIAEGGLDPVMAIRIGTLNPAEYFHLHDRGAIAPGRRADLFIFSDLNAPRPEEVYRGGHLVAKNGQMVARVNPPRVKPLPRSVNVRWTDVDFSIPAKSHRIRVIGSLANQLVTEHHIMDARTENGHAIADLERDILKMAVIERHHASGNMGQGFITGIGLKRGAIAGTVAHDHHNLVVIGVDDASMLHAAHAVERMGGGLVAMDGDEMLAQLPLPVGGLMSDQPVDVVREQLDALLTITREGLGSPLHDPFMAMSFMALEVIPSLKLTDQGLVDVDEFKIVELFV